MKTKLQHSLFGYWEDCKQNGEWSLDFCNRIPIDTSDPDNIKQLIKLINESKIYNK
jgi:hypothetical protein